MWVIRLSSSISAGRFLKTSSGTLAPIPPLLSCFKAPDYAEVVFETAGVYEINIQTNLADCRDSYGQSITILEREGDGDAGGRISADPTIDLIKNFTVHPTRAMAHLL
jgi:hypothetical protein